MLLDTNTSNVQSQQAMGATVEANLVRDSGRPLVVHNPGKRDVLAGHCDLFANPSLVRGLAKSGPIVVAYDPHSKGCERE
jgi:hypothetical protein